MFFLSNKRQWKQRQKFNLIVKIEKEVNKKNKKFVF